MGEYIENEEKEEIDIFERSMNRYREKGIFLPQKQREMYEAIKNDIIVWEKLSLKRKVVDVGCGIGIGSNILSQESIFVWGIDKSEKNIEVARQLFARRRLPQVTFDIVDLITFPRETAKFQIVTLIEVIEHIKDASKALQMLKARFGKEDTIFYISSPNRNADELSKEKPENEYHVRE